MKVKVEVKSKVAVLNDVLKKVSGMECLVGIPAGKASRDTGAKINNATIGYINEFGSERMHIPARPHLVTGVKKAHSKISDIMAKSLKKELELKGRSDFKKTLSACGLVASASVKTMLQEGLKPSLAPSTIKQRARQTKGDHSGDIPLINTGNYMNHITYVVKKK